jgi:hypothetical protein
MKLPRRKFLHLAVGAAALPVVSRIARAEAKGSVDNDEFEIEHLAIAFGRPLEQPVLARVAGTDSHRDGCDRTVRNELDVARRWSLGVIIGHGFISLTFGQLCPGCP